MSISFSRRQFLLTSAAAAGATWFDVPQILADTRDESLKKYGGFPMGIQSYSLRGFRTLDAIIEKTAGLELHYIEFWGNHFRPNPDAKYVKGVTAKLAKHDIVVNGFGVHGFREDHAKNEKVFQFAKMAGIRNITCGAPPEAFESLDKLVKKYDIRLALHNHGPKSRYDKIDDAIKAAKPWDKRIGYCADLGHYIRSGEDPVEAIHKLGDRLYGVHLKDAKGGWTLLGKGNLNLVDVFTALKKDTFPADGTLSLEYERKWKDPIADIRQSLAAAKAAQLVARG